MKFLYSSMLFFSLLQCSFCATNFYNSTSHNETLSRNKRFLIFPPNTGGSVLKVITSYLGPIDIPSWGNVNFLRNFQYQYNLPTTWITKIPTWPEGRSFNGNKNFSKKIKSDSSRKIAYELFEDTLKREKKNGRECLLRTICEIAETPVGHNGLIGELLQIFFTPGKYEKIDDDYRYAMKAGLHHVDCLKLYPDCPFGDGVLDTFSLINNFHFDNVLNF